VIVIFRYIMHGLMGSYFILAIGRWRRIRARWVVVLPLAAIPLLIAVGLLLSKWYRDGPFLSDVRKGDLRAVQSFLEQDPSVLGTRDFGGNMALSVAVIANQPEIAGYLLQRGANPNDPEDADPPLLHAALYGLHEIADLLIRHGADVHATGYRGKRPAIQMAAWCGHASVVELLISHGANVGAVDRDGSTPMIDAARRGHVEVVHVLLKNGARANAFNQYGETALKLAKKNGHYRIVALLRKHGAVE